MRDPTRLLPPTSPLGLVALLAFAALGCITTETALIPPSAPLPRPASGTAQPAQLGGLITEVGYHERKVYEQQQSVSLRMLCVPEDMWGAPPDNNPRAPVSLRGAVDPGMIASIQSTFAYFDDGIRTLEVLHGRFLDLRRLYDAARADEELLRLVIQEALATMYQARRLLDLQRGLEVNGCSLAPLRPPLKGVAELLSNVGDVELPALLKIYEKGANPWVMTLLKVQYDVLLDHDISDVCAKVIASMTDPIPQEDTAILAWCGYAVASVEDTSFARKYWRQAGRSVHDPASASYALARLRELQDLPPADVRGKGVRVVR